MTGQLLFAPPRHVKRSGSATVVGGRVSTDLSQQISDAEEAAATAAASPSTQIPPIA